MSLDIAEHARKKFKYDPETGSLTSRKTGHLYSALDRGYLEVRLKGKKYRAHRIIFLIMTGRWPTIIDHINRNRADNRWCNLREVSKAQNSINSDKQTNNKTGICGVSYNVERDRYIANIRVNYRLMYLGCYKNFLDAVVARLEAEVKYGFNKIDKDSSAKKYIEDLMTHT